MLGVEHERYEREDPRYRTIQTFLCRQLGWNSTRSYKKAEEMFRFFKEGELDPRHSAQWGAYVDNDGDLMIVDFPVRVKAGENLEAGDLLLIRKDGGIGYLSRFPNYPSGKKDNFMTSASLQLVKADFEGRDWVNHSLELTTDGDETVRVTRSRIGGSFRATLG